MSTDHERERHLDRHLSCKGDPSLHDISLSVNAGDGDEGDDKAARLIGRSILSLPTKYSYYSLFFTKKQSFAFYIIFIVYILHAKKCYIETGQNLSKCYLASET